MGAERPLPFEIEISGTESSFAIGALLSQHDFATLTRSSGRAPESAWMRGWL